MSGTSQPIATSSGSETKSVSPGINRRASQPTSEASQPLMPKTNKRNKFYQKPWQQRQVSMAGCQTSERDDVESNGSQQQVVKVEQGRSSEHQSNRVSVKIKKTISSISADKKSDDEHATISQDKEEDQGQDLNSPLVAVQKKEPASMTQIRTDAPESRNHKRTDVQGSSNEISVTQVREYSMIDSHQTNPAVIGGGRTNNLDLSPIMLIQEKGASQAEFISLRGQSIPEESDQQYNSLHVRNEYSGRIAKGSGNASPATLNADQLSTELQVFPANKANVVGEIGVSHKRSTEAIDRRARKVGTFEDQFIRANLTKFQSWEQHHCVHCRHFKFFINADLSHTQEQKDQDKLLDMGSLMLREILQQQRLGGCCRAFCTHCRRDHFCTQRRRLAVIDISSGADAQEAKDRSRSFSPYLRHSQRFFAENHKYEYSHHQFNQGAMKPAEFSELVDAYQLNVFGREVLRKIRQMRRSPQRNGIKSQPRNSHSLEAGSNQIGIDGEVSNQVVCRGSPKQFQSNQYKLDPAVVNDGERLYNAGTDKNLDIVLLQPRPPMPRIVRNNLDDSVAEKTNESASFDYIPQPNKVSTTPSALHHLQKNKYNNSTGSQMAGTLSSQKQGKMTPQNNLTIPDLIPESGLQGRDPNVRQIACAPKNLTLSIDQMTSNSGSPMKQRFKQSTAKQSPTQKKDLNSKTSHGVYSNVYSFGDGNFKTLTKGEFRAVPEGDVTFGNQNVQMDLNPQKIETTKLVDAREFTFKEERAGSPNSSTFKDHLNLGSLKSPANMQISIKSNRTPRLEEGSNEKDVVPGKPRTGPSGSELSSILRDLKQTHGRNDSERLVSGGGQPLTDPQNQIKFNIQQLQENLEAIEQNGQFQLKTPAIAVNKQYQNKQFGVNQARKKIPFNHFNHPQVLQYPLGQSGQPAKESKASTRLPSRKEQESAQRKQRKTVISNNSKQRKESCPSRLVQHEYQPTSVHQTSRGVGDSQVHSQSEDGEEKHFEGQKQEEQYLPVIMPQQPHMKNNSHVQNYDGFDRDLNIMQNISNEEDLNQGVSVTQDFKKLVEKRYPSEGKQPEPAQAQAGFNFHKDALKSPPNPRGGSVSDRFQNRMIQFQIASRMDDEQILRNSLQQSNVICQRQIDYQLKNTPKKRSQKQVHFRFDSMEKQKMLNSLTFRTRKPEALQIEQQIEQHMKCSPRNIVHRAEAATSTPVVRPSNRKRPSPSPRREATDMGEVSISQLDPSPIKMKSTFFFGAKADDNQKQTNVGNNELTATFRLPQNGIGIRAGDPSPFGVGASKQSSSSRLSGEESKSRSEKGSRKRRKRIKVNEQEKNDELQLKLIEKIAVKQSKEISSRGVRIIKDKQGLQNAVHHDNHPSSPSEELGSDIRGSDGVLLEIASGSVAAMKSNFDHSRSPNCHTENTSADKLQEVVEGPKRPPRSPQEIGQSPPVGLIENVQTEVNTTSVSQEKSLFKVQAVPKSKDDKTPYFSKNKAFTQSKSPNSTVQSRQSRVSKVSNDKKKLLKTLQITKLDTSNQNFEVKGNKKEINQNYLNLQLQILGVQPENQEDLLAEGVRENSQNVENKDKANLPTNTIPGAEVVVHTEQSMKSQNQTLQFSQPATREVSNTATPKTVRGLCNDPGDDDDLTVEEKLNKILQQPKYIHYNTAKIVAPSSNQTYQHNRMLIQGDLAQRYKQDAEQFEHLGLEIQGQVVRMEDPYAAQQRHMRRQQILKRIEQENKYLVESTIRQNNNKKLNQDLIESIGTINVSMDGGGEGYGGERQSQFTINEMDEKNGRQSGRGHEESLVEGSIMLNQSLLGDITQSNRSSRKKALNKDPMPNSPKLDAIREYSASKGIETEANDDAVKASINILPGAANANVLPNPALFNLRHTDSSDFSLIRDFILFYSKNRFKRFKHHNKTLEDHLFLNQPVLKDKNLLVDLYYKLRQSQNLESNVKNYQERIQEKVNQILEEQAKHTQKLYDTGGLLADKKDPSLLSGQEQNNQKDQQSRNKSLQGVNASQISTVAQPSDRGLLREADQKSKRRYNEIGKDDDEIIFEDQSASQRMSIRQSQDGRPNANDSILSSAKRIEGKYTPFEASLMNYAVNTGAARHDYSSSTQSRVPWQKMNASLIDRETVKFSNALNFNSSDYKAVRKSDLKEFQQSKYMKCVRENIRGGTNTGAPPHKDSFGERPDTPDSIWQQNRLGSSDLHHRRVMTGDINTIPVNAEQKKVVFADNFPFFKKQENHTLNSSIDGKSQSRNRGILKCPNTADQAEENVVVTAQLANKFLNIRRHLNTSQQYQRDAQISHLGELSAGNPIKTSDYNAPQTVQNYAQKSLKSSSIMRESVDNRQSQLKSKQFKSSQCNESKYTRSTINRINQKKINAKIDSKEYMEYLTNRKPMLPALGLSNVIEKQRTRSFRSKYNSTGPKPGTNDPKADQNQVYMFHMNLYNERILLGAKPDEKAAIRHEMDSIKMSTRERAQSTCEHDATATDRRADSLFAESVTHDGRQAELPSSMRKYLDSVPPQRLSQFHDDHTQYLNFEQQLRDCSEDDVGKTAQEVNTQELTASERMAAAPLASHMPINEPGSNQRLALTSRQLENMLPKRRQNPCHFLRTNLHLMQIDEMKASEFTHAKLKMRSQKEERERILGPQFNKAEIRKQRLLATRQANDELERLNRFMAAGATGYFQE